MYLVRHGQDEDNANRILNGRRDTSLTDLGKSQARDTALKLKNFNIDVVYSSPLKRAYETARIITKEIGVDEIICDQHLIERDFGILTGKPFSGIEKYTTKILEIDKVKYFLEVDGAESFPALYKRAEKILSEIRERHKNKSVLVVSHGDIGKMIREMKDIMVFIRLIFMVRVSMVGIILTHKQ